MSSESNPGIQEVRIAAKKPEHDVLGHKVERGIEEFFGFEGVKVRTVAVFWLEGVSSSEAQRFASALAFPLIEQTSVNKPLLDHPRPEELICISYHPGMTDPKVESIKKFGQSLGVNILAAKTGTEYAFYGDLTPTRVDAIRSVLYNPVIEEVITQTPETLMISGKPGLVLEVPILDASPEQLMEISKTLKLNFDPARMDVFQAHFRKLGRNPTDVEALYLAGAKSDHCAHLTFNADIIYNGQNMGSLFDMIKAASARNGDANILSAFHDNSGIVRFYSGKAVNMKAETHNSPSGEDPPNGAATGVGGVLRDINKSGRIAKAFLVIDQYGVARLKISQAEIPPGCIDPRTMLTGVVEGVRDYGNPVGVPTRNGSTSFDDSFIVKPTVLVAAYGIMDADKAHSRPLSPGDKVIVIGGRTGRDGIGGATFSSADKDKDTKVVHAKAVQIGNPIEEKRMFDATESASEEDLIEKGTDFGAAGFNALAEIAEKNGIDFDLARAPLKYEGLAPWEIMTSESQERGAVVVTPQNLKRFLEICRQNNVEATIMGEITGTNKLVVRYQDQTVIGLDYQFIKEGWSKDQLTGETYTPQRDVREAQTPTNWQQTLVEILSHGDVCSRQPIDSQYDWGVQGTNALAPYTGVDRDCPNDASIQTPILGRRYGWVASHEMNPRLSRLSPYDSSLTAASIAMSKLVAVGGNPDRTWWMNNYISAKPDNPQIIGALYECVKGVCDAMDIYRRSVISGKDSCSSSYVFPNGDKIEVIPYASINLGGRITDVRKTISADIKSPDSTLVLVGQIDPRLGGSVYLDNQDLLGEQLPQIDSRLAPKVLRQMYRAIRSGEVRAVKAVSKGGVLSIASKMCFGGDCGIELFLPDDISKPEAFLFNETPATFVVEVRDQEVAADLFAKIPYRVLGKTIPDRSIKVDDLFSISMPELKQAWKEPMERLFA